VIIERDESDAGVFLGSVHESIAIFVLAVFFPFNSLVVDEGIVEIVLVFAIIFFVFIFNTEVTTSAAAKVVRNRFIIGIVVNINYFGRRSLERRHHGTPPPYNPFLTSRGTNMAWYDKPTAGKIYHGNKQAFYRVRSFFTEFEK
jgi:hypothetical protein